MRIQVFGVHKVVFGNRHVWSLKQQACVIRSYGHFDWGQLIWNNLNLIQMCLVIANNPFVFLGMALMDRGGKVYIYKV
jgi:hypothetical protein